MKIKFIGSEQDIQCWPLIIIPYDSFQNMLFKLMISTDKTGRLKAYQRVMFTANFIEVPTSFEWKFY